MQHRYDVGDTIAYQPFVGGVRTIVVTYRDDNIKDGYAGFDGYIIGHPDMTVWGYDDQIVGVVATA
jgi:hypothetical protein